MLERPVALRPSECTLDTSPYDHRYEHRFGRDPPPHAHGGDPAASPELALRAEQLRSPTERARIANDLVEALGDARRVGEPLTIRSLGYRAAVRDAADDVLALALRLREDQPVGTAAVAMAAWLVGSKSSPMRRDGAGDLHEAVQAALETPDVSQSRATSIIDARAA